MLISINTASTKPTERIKDIDKTKDKALAHIKKIVIRIYTVKNIHIKKDTGEAKEIKDSDKKNAMFITNKAASQQSTSLKNVREYTKGFANKLYI
jgi:hypothetical protein